MAALGAVQNPVVEAPKSYYFNASRWVWTGREFDEISLDNIRGYDGISVSKIVWIATLCIPAFLYDLIRMAVAKCLGSREVRPLAAAAPQQEAVVPYVDPENGPKERVAFLTVCLGGIKAVLPIVMAYLPQEGLLFPEPSLESIFFIDEETRKLVNKERGSKSPWVSWEAAKNLPESVYPTIEKLFFVRSEGTTQQFIELIDKLPHLKQVMLPVSEEDQGAGWAGAIRELQGSLEGIEFSFGLSVESTLLSDSVVTALIECPRLTELSMQGLIPQGARQTDENARLMIRLAQKGQLQKLTLSANQLQNNVLEAFFTHCPLRCLDVRFAYDNPPPEYLFDRFIQALRTRPREQRLVSLKYYAYNIRNDQLRSLAECCPDLEVLQVPVGYDQGSVFAEILPQLKRLKSFHFNHTTNAHILTAVRNNPSLQMLRLDFSMSIARTTLEVIEDLAKLGRPLVLDIHWCFLHSGLTDHQKARLERKLKPYSHIRIVKTQEEGYSFTREAEIL